MSGLLAAIQLLTVVPIGRRSAFDAPAMRRSAAFFPLVGLGIGLALSGFDWLVRLALPELPASALVVVAGVALTGAVHLDGLGDTFDALFGGRTPERRLEILKDPRIGAFGATAIGGALILKWAAIASLDPSVRWAIIAMAPVAGRWAALLLLSLFRSAQATGLGSTFRGSGPAGLAGGTAIAVVAIVALLGPPGLGPVLIAGLGVLAGGWFAASRLGGGLTGDVYGAGVELAEIFALLVAVAMIEAGLAMS